MKISLNWLRDYVDVPETPGELAALLTMAGLEVGCVTELGYGIDDVVVAQILTKGPHPDADRLSLCTVNDGVETHTIVCGATNMKAGDRVALARIGATLPGNFKIKRAKIRGQESFGMMCSHRELGLGEDHSGLIILPPDAPLGVKVVEVLGLPDAILEVEITPNRPDWLSVVGVAREVAALTGRKLNLPAPVIAEEGQAAATLSSVTLLAPDLCPRYAARLIRGVKIAPSPLWLKTRLEAAGVRPISNVVDVTNYVLMELGHPLHAFDFNKLDGRRIVVRRAAEGEKFTTLDGQERTMTAQNLMICDGGGSVAVAGIMGGLNSEVDDATTDILLESAYFAPSSIRRTAKQLGLKTEASYRFERGADIEGLILALERATALIIELAGGKAAPGRIDEYPEQAKEKRVTLRLAKAASVIGIPFGREEAQRILEGLGLETLEADDTRILFRAPHYRVDIEREIDLIEELARVKGYQHVPATMPKMTLGSDERAPRPLADIARDALSSLGLNEVINLSFVDPDDDTLLALAPDSPLRAKVTLQNPLGKETSVLRTSLLPGLLHTAGLNARRGMRDAKIFEVGRTFHPVEGSKLPVETNRAAALVTGRREPLAWWAASDKTGFYDIKGILERTLARLGIKGVTFCAAAEKEWLQPGRAATFSAGGVELGWLGEIHPDLLDAFELTAPVAAFQLDLEKAADAAVSVSTFPGLTRFPAVERDLALIVDRSVLVAEIEAAVGELGIELLKSVALFDAFEGGKIPEGKQSLALRFTWQSAERTLTEEEVAQKENLIVDCLVRKLGARLRDS